MELHAQREAFCISYGISSPQRPLMQALARATEVLSAASK